MIPGVNKQRIQSALARPSARVLVLVNLGLIYGVLALGWSVFDILFLYWCENLVIGVLNVARMIFADPPSPLSRIADTSDTLNEEQQAVIRTLSGRVATLGIKLFLIPFFVVHYGMFCFGHGVFVFALFGDGMDEAGLAGDTWALLQGPLGISLAMLTASHLYSFFANYLGKGEYQRANLAVLMFQPYGRIVVLHITILVGGFLAMALGSPVWLLAVLVILKTLVDLGMHDREHDRMASS